MSETPTAEQDAIEQAATNLLIELAFLLPIGTNVRQHPIAQKLLAFTQAVKESAREAPAQALKDKELEIELEVRHGRETAAIINRTLHQEREAHAQAITALQAENARLRDVQRIVVEAPNGGVVAAPCCIEGCQYGQVEATDAQLRTLQAEHEECWKAIERSYDIEPRDVFEREAPTNGFQYPLVQAIHTIWKREPKVEVVEAQLRTVGQALRELRKELRGWDEAAFIDSKLDALLTTLEPPA